MKQGESSAVFVHFHQGSQDMVKLPQQNHICSLENSLEMPGHHLFIKAASSMCVKKIMSFYIKKDVI